MGSFEGKMEEEEDYVEFLLRDFENRMGANLELFKRGFYVNESEFIEAIEKDELVSLLYCKEELGGLSPLKERGYQIEWNKFEGFVDEGQSPILLSKVHGNILAKVLEYCKSVVTQPPADENHVDLKAFVSVLVNDHEEAVFGLLVAVDYLDIKSLLSLVCEDVSDMIKRKDLEHIRRIFNITQDFSPEEEEQKRRENPWAFN
ncbi:hypothetical protein M9H77_29705 [Catharanthus roseus]|uniref:Uncharacterized protein n=1 Tax=Catharanthus roseus TaxID=4058 RepID=A0ACB9ZXD8_CATRO|nr:hypothetical protein M9H77_29705 [Catharanthus roseus]